MCGIIGVSNHRNAVQLAYLGLFSLQHRGQEAAGIVASHNGTLKGKTALGLVAEAFPEETLKKIGQDLQKYIELQLDHILPNTREALVKSVVDMIKDNVQIIETEDPHLISQTIAEALARAFHPRRRQLRRSPCLERLHPF